MAESHPIPTHPRFQDLTGRTFGRLRAVSYAGRDRRGHAIWNCVCDCGGEKVVEQYYLTSGHTQSCGCHMRLGNSERMRAFHARNQIMPLTPAACEQVRSRFGVIGRLVPVTGAPGYVVSDCGRIFSAVFCSWKPPEVHELELTRHRHGYRMVRLHVHKRARHALVHVLMAKAFLPPPLPGQTQVRHLNGDPADNRVDNLAWGTPRENVQDTIRHGRIACGEKSPRAKLTAAQVVDIRARAAKGESIASLAREYELTQSGMRGVVRRRNWKHV